MNRKLFANLRADLAHFRVSHRLVGFVFEIQRLAALEIVAHEAVEDHQRAVFGRFQRFQHLAAGGSARAPAGKHRPRRVVCCPAPCPPLTGGRNATSSPVASGARHPEYSWFTDAAIDGAKFRQLRKTPPVALEKILDASAFGKLGLFLGNAGNVLQLPEKKHANAHRPILARGGRNPKRRLGFRCAALAPYVQCSACVSRGVFHNL